MPRERTKVTVLFLLLRSGAVAQRSLVLRQRFSSLGVSCVLAPSLTLCLVPLRPALATGMAERWTSPDLDLGTEVIGLKLRDERSKCGKASVTF